MTDPVQLITDVLLPAFQREQRGTAHRAGLKKVDEYVHGIQADQVKPHDNTMRPYRTLMERSKFNLLSLVPKTRAQGLVAESFRSNDPDATNSQSWQIWVDNRWDMVQAQVWNATLTYGVSYATVLPSADKSKPSIKAYSPRQFIAMYDDPANDEWPECAMRIRGLTPDGNFPESEKGRVRVTYYDDTSVIEYVQQGSDKEDWVETSSYEHGAGVCPVVRFVSDLDLEGRYVGEVEPLIREQDRLNQALFDLMMVQTFNSFKLRWVAGVMVGDVDEDGNPIDNGSSQRNKTKIAQDSMLVFPDADTKVGSLEETSMEPFINNAIFVIRQFAIASQTPPQNFLGDIGGNIAAEALSALESSAERKTNVLKTVFGEAAGQMLRLAAKLAGIKAEATDYSLEIKWAETETRSLAQVADAWGKIAVMLQVPVEQVWERIPGVSLEDVQRWREAKKKQDALMLVQQAALGGANGNTAAPGQSSGTGSSSNVVRPTATQLGSAFGSGGGAGATGAQRS